MQQTGLTGIRLERTDCARRYAAPRALTDSQWIVSCAVAFGCDLSDR